MWISSLFIVGMLVGASHPQTASAAGQAAGAALSIPLFLIATMASIILTTLGILPGTKKPDRH